MSDMDDFIRRHEAAVRLGEELGTRKRKRKRKDDPEVELMAPGLAILPTTRTGPDTPLMLIIQQTVIASLHAAASAGVGGCEDHETQAECLGALLLYTFLTRGFVLVHQPANARQILGEIDERRAKERTEEKPKRPRTPPAAKDRLN